MASRTTARGGGSLGQLKEEIEVCRNCPLWQHATQAVGGEGKARARIMIVGEQPGSQEDLAGRPFVGPAGKLLNRALHDAGLNREETWITNAVKHFKWKPRGKVRLHQKPAAREIEACKPWLLREIRIIAPETVILMGATASRSLLGPGIKVTQQRGPFDAPEIAPRVIVTIHPSSLLRRSAGGFPEEEYQAFVRDLALAAAR